MASDSSSILMLRSRQRTHLGPASRGTGEDISAQERADVSELSAPQHCFRRGFEVAAYLGSQSRLLWPGYTGHRVEPKVTLRTEVNFSLPRELLSGLDTYSKPPSSTSPARFRRLSTEWHGGCSSHVEKGMLFVSKRSCTSSGKVELRTHCQLIFDVYIESDIEGQIQGSGAEER